MATFYCGKAVWRNVLATFFCYFVLADIADNATAIQCEPQTNKSENVVDAPEVFPNNSSEVNGKKILPNPKNLTQNLCLGTIMRAVSSLVVNQNIEKNKSSKIFSKVRDTYSQLVKNMTDNLLNVITQIEYAYNFSNFEQCLTMIDMPTIEHETKSTNSFLVPALLVIILVLISYSAFLYQKIRQLHYKNSNLLIEEE